MTSTREQIPLEIRSFCERIAEGLEHLKDHETCIDFVRGELPALLLNRPLFVELMRSVVDRRGYPDVRHPTMFDNELLLYLDNQRRFSLRMYLWGPGEFTRPHDHNSWGVIGTVSEGYEVTNYRREDDGSVEGYARLVEVEKLRLCAGETAFTLPFNAGIHKTGNSGQNTIVTLHLYGRSLSRGYLNGYDLTRNRVYKILPARTKKELLAAQALNSLEPHLSLDRIRVGERQQR